MALIRDIAGYDNGSAPRLLNPGGAFLRIVMLLEVGDQDVGAFPSESQRHGAADAAVGARNQRCLACKAAATLVAFLAVVRTWPHGFFLSRHRLLAGLERRPRIGSARIK